MRSCQFRLQRLLFACIFAVNTMMVRHKGTSFLVNGFSSIPTMILTRGRFSSGTSDAARFISSPRSSKLRQGLSRQQRRQFSRFRWSDDTVRMSARAEGTSDEEIKFNNETAAGKIKDSREAGFAPKSQFTETEIDTVNGQNATSGNNKTATSASDEALNVLAIDPNMVEIVVIENDNTPGDTPEESEVDDPMSSASRSDMLFRQLPFVSMFRGSANYIANHRNTLAVYHIPGELMDLPDASVLRDLMNDISLTWLLGMRIVIVVGCRHQIDKRMEYKREKHLGMTITDAETLRVVKEEAGYVRFEVERQLARSLRMQGAGGGGSSRSDGGSQGAGFPSAPTTTSGSGYFDGNVVSGNFYSAQPFGILDGIDFKYSGFVRRVEVDKIRQVHRSRDIILLTTLGVSPSGEVFNVNSESLAATVAGSLDASKLIFFTEKEVELRHKIHGNKIQHFRVNDSRRLLDQYDVKVHKRGFVNLGHRCPTDGPSQNMLVKLGWAMHALEQGVKRAHVISPKHGALLQELYTRDGSGTLISRDLYDGIRQAKVEDVSMIHDLILPLIEMGTLVDRPKAVLEKTIDMYHVYTRDDLVVACGQLKLFEDGYAELGCLVVNPQYRSRGRGDAMLGYLERMCLQKGASIVFVLSTQTMEWFVERGFDEVTVDKLPPSRQESYNHKRASKIYMKKIDSLRDLDASELWWNR